MTVKFELFKNYYLMLYKKYISEVIVEPFDVNMDYNNDVDISFCHDLFLLKETFIFLRKAILKNDGLAIKDAFLCVRSFCMGINNMNYAIMEDIYGFFKKQHYFFKKIETLPPVNYGTPSKNPALNDISFEELKGMYRFIIDYHSNGFIKPERLLMNYDVNWDDEINRLLFNFNSEVIKLDGFREEDLNEEQMDCLRRIHYAALQLSRFFKHIWCDASYLGDIPTWPEFPEGYKTPEHYNFPY